MSVLVCGEAITKQVFEACGIGAGQLPKAEVGFPPLDWKAEADRAARVEQGAGPASPGCCGTRRRCCSAICGCGPILRHGTAASSLSAP